MSVCEAQWCEREALIGPDSGMHYDYCSQHICKKARCNLQVGHENECVEVGAVRIHGVAPSHVLPADAAARKAVPLARGLLDYFPNALAAVAELSRIGNEQHNAGQEMHWAREKSTDHADCILRHMIDRGTVDTDGVSHSAKVAWRALAMLETELLAKGAKPGRNAK